MPIWDEARSDPIIHLVSNKHIHILTLESKDSESRTRLTVARHDFTRMDMPFVSPMGLHDMEIIFKCQRCVYFYTAHSTSTFKFPTMDIKDFTIVGSIQVKLEQQEVGELFSPHHGMDFDEVSGRVLLVTWKEDDGVAVWYLHIGSVV